MAQLVKNPPAMQETWVWEDLGRPSLGWEDLPWVGKIPWRRERLPTPVFWPGELHGLYHGVTKSQTRLSNFNFHFHYEQLYGNEMDNLEEMERFLENFNLPRLNQEEIEIMNNPTTSTEIEAVIKKKKSLP